MTFLFDWLILSDDYWLILPDKMGLFQPDANKVLMDKLNEQSVGLFVITDHNRYWTELYTRVDAFIRKMKT